MYQRLAIIIFTLFFACSWVFSQSESATNYSTKDGLPSSQVYDIIQDDFGYLWFSTDKGLSRFDGYEFENFDKSDGLSDNVVFDFFKKPNGQIWCTTNAASLFYFEGKKPQFTPYKYNDSINAYAASIIPHSIYVSMQNDIYLSFHDNFDLLEISRKGEILRKPIRIRFDKNNKHVPGYIEVLKNDAAEPFYFVSNNSEESRLANSELYSVPDSVNLCRVTRRFEALYFEEKNTGVFMNVSFISIQTPEGIRKINCPKEIISSGKFQGDYFWVGFRYGGVTIFDLSGNVVQTYLPDRSVTQLYTDHEGGVWISTLEYGVYALTQQSVKALTGIGEKHISALSKGEEQDLFIGGYNGEIYNRSKYGELSLFYSSETFQKPVHFTFDERKNRIYMSCNRIIDLKQNNLEDGHVDYVNFIKEKYIVSGTSGLNLYNLENNENSKIFEDIRTKDAVYFNKALYAASIYGLYKTNLNPAPNSEELLFEGNRIDDLEFFRNCLVLGTNGNGLIFIDKRDQLVLKISEDDGLTSNYITKVFQENNNTIWVCTNQGVNRIKFKRTLRDYTIDRLNVSDGLSSNEVWDLVVLKDTVWIGTQRGVNYISKNEFNNFKHRNYNYFLQWKSISVNESKIVDRYDFSYDENNIEFDVLGISFGAENELTYQYKLIGLSNKWNYTKNRKITFSSLPPGNYEFIVKLKGKNDSSDYNKIRYAFVINPPFWETWWFILLCLVLIVALVYSFFKIRVLTYNKDVVREILRVVLQKIRRNEPVLILRVNGNNIKVKSSDIHFIKTSGNYLEVHLEGKMHLIRSSISKFLERLPDKIEFLQVHRSYVVRIDKVQQKGKDEIVVLDTRIPIGRTYLDQIKAIDL